MNTLNVWLPSWVILDGNYRNFRAGQEADFALLFDSLSGTKTSEGRPSLWPVKANQYRFCGQTIFWGQECWVLDAGVHGYCDYPIPPKAVEGTWWAGVLATRIDPFFYFEELSKHPAVPPLIYSWRIDRIRIDRTPRISERDEKGRLTLWRDEEREMFEELPATDAWAPAYRDLDYLLTCTRIGGPSRARRADYRAYDRADSRDHVGTEVKVTVDGYDAVLATILQVSNHEPLERQALVRLERPLLQEGKSYHYAVVFPRYEGEGIDRLSSPEVFYCSIKGLDPDIALSSRSFVLRQWHPTLPMAAELIRL